MNDPNKQKYVHYYNATALALGGRITRPFDAIIDTQASSVLPITGGLSSARVENFRFRDMISFKTAYSLVTGSESKRDGSFATLASVTIEDLNILEVVTAQRVVCRVSSNHPIGKMHDDGRLDDSPEPEIFTVGSTFEGLRVAGCELDVAFDTDRSHKWGTYKTFKDNNPKLKESKSVIVCSLVKSITKKGSCAGVNIPENENLIEVPHFGRIYVAQLLCSSNTRRLVMLRVQLGCPAGGEAIVGCGQSNGHTVP